MNRLVMAAGGAAVLLLCGALGVTALAQGAPTTTPTPAASATRTSAQQRRQAILSDAASQLGVSETQLQQALAQARKDVGANAARPLADLRQDELQVAAQAIGLADVKTLRGELAGTTLNTVAQNHNVAPSTVSAAILADLNSKLQAAVTAGTIKASQVTTLTQRAQNRVTALMTHQFPVRP
jgi:hypothetical protein